MGKTYTGGGSDAWKDDESSSDFWDDLDMWRAMREADEVAIARDDQEAADAYDDELLAEIDGRADIQDGQLMLDNNIDDALEGSRTHHYGHYSTYTAGGNCNGCGQRYGHSIMCPVVNPNTAFIDRDQVRRRRSDAAAAFDSREYKDWSKSNRGGPEASRGTKPTAVLVDMDGTIDDCGQPNQFGLDYVRRMHKAGHVIVIGTARTMEVEYERSHKWLVRELAHKYQIPFVGPFCRSRDDMRFACHFKRGLIDTLSGVYDFVGAIDDDRWCLDELRKVKGLEVVTAKPGQWDPDHWRSSTRGGGRSSFRKGKKLPKHRNTTQA